MGVREAVPEPIMDEVLGRLATVWAQTTPDLGAAALHRLGPDFVARVQEMAALADIELPEKGMVNLETLRDTLAALPGVTVTQVEAPEENLLDLAFSFEDAPAMFPSPSLLWEAGIVTFEEVEEGTRVRLYLDLDNYKQLEQIFPVPDLLLMHEPVDLEVVFR